MKTTVAKGLAWSTPACSRQRWPSSDTDGTQGPNLRVGYQSPQQESKSPQSRSVGQFLYIRAENPSSPGPERGAEGSDPSSWKQTPVPFLRSLTRRPHIAPEELWENPTLTLSYRSILATSESPESATLSVGLRRVPKNALHPLRTSHFEVSSTSSPSEAALMLPDVDHSWNICLHYTWHVKGQLQKHSHSVTEDSVFNYDAAKEQLKYSQLSSAVWMQINMGCLLAACSSMGMAYLHQLILNHHLRAKQKHSCHLLSLLHLEKQHQWPVWAGLCSSTNHQPHLGWKTRALSPARNHFQKAQLCFGKDFRQPSLNGSLEELLRVSVTFLSD